MEEKKLYPPLIPSAPPNDLKIGHDPFVYRLSEIQKIRNTLNDDISKYDTVLKKTKRLYNVAHWIGSGSNVLTGGSGIASIVFVCTASGAVAAIPIASVALTAGLCSLISNFISKKIVHKTKI